MSERHSLSGPRDDEVPTGPGNPVLGGLRALIALPTSLLAVLVTIVLFDMLRGVDPAQETSDTEVAVALLGSLLVAMWLWRWLGRRGPLRNLPAELTAAEALAARTASLVASLWAGVRLLIFGFVTLVMLLAWFIIATALGVDIEDGNTARSNQQFVVLLLLSILSTALLWWRERRRRRELAEARAEAFEEPELDALPEPGTLALQGEDVVPATLLGDAPAELPAVSFLADPPAPRTMEPAPRPQRDLGPGPTPAGTPPLDAAILDELDSRQRRALWVLSENGSATASELAETLDMRLARVPGFMNGLDRQLGALGHRCFRAETLPSGEPHYVFSPQEPSR